MNTLIQSQMNYLAGLSGLNQDSALSILSRVYAVDVRFTNEEFKLPSGSYPKTLLKAAKPDLSIVSPYHEIIRLQIIFETCREVIEAGLEKHSVMPMLYGYESSDELYKLVSSMDIPSIEDLDNIELYQSVMGSAHPSVILSGGPLMVLADSDRLLKLFDILKSVNAPYDHADLVREDDRIYSLNRLNHPMRAPDTWIVTPTASKSYNEGETSLLFPISDSKAFVMADGQNLATDDFYSFYILKMGKTYSYRV